MTAVQWVKTVKCDVPGCVTTDTCDLPPTGSTIKVVPKGWLTVDMYLPNARSNYVFDFCPVCSQLSFREIISRITAEDELVSHN